MRCETLSFKMRARSEKVYNFPVFCIHHYISYTFRPLKPNFIHLSLGRIPYGQIQVYCSSISLNKNSQLAQNELYRPRLGISSYYFKMFMARYGFNLKLMGKNIFTKPISLKHVINFLFPTSSSSFTFTIKFYITNQAHTQIHQIPSAQMAMKISWKHIRVFFPELKTQSGFQ